VQSLRAATTMDFSDWDEIEFCGDAQRRAERAAANRTKHRRKVSFSSSTVEIAEKPNLTKRNSIFSSLRPKSILNTQDDDESIRGRPTRSASGTSRSRQSSVTTERSATLKKGEALKPYLTLGRIDGKPGYSMRAGSPVDADDESESPNDHRIRQKRASSIDCE